MQKPGRNPKKIATNLLTDQNDETISPGKIMQRNLARVLDFNGNPNSISFFRFPGKEKGITSGGSSNNEKYTDFFFNLLISAYNCQFLLITSSSKNGIGEK